MRLIKDLNRILSEAISAADKRKLINLKSTDRLIVYHGTTKQDLLNMINGFDATEVRYRHMSDKKHTGLFITSDPDVAERFAYHGSVVLELDVRAKNLHGTDFGGNIGRTQKKYSKMDWINKKYPNSFRPYLTFTMLRRHEPQGLLVGLISPNQIKRIRWKEDSDDKPVWYTRKEFLQKKIKIAKDPYDPERVKEVKDIGYDLSSTKHSLEKYVEITAKAANVSYSRADKTVQMMVKMGFDRFSDSMQFVGFGEKAMQSFYKKAKQYYAR